MTLALCVDWLVSRISDKLIMVADATGFDPIATRLEPSGVSQYNDTLQLWWSVYIQQRGLKLVIHMDPCNIVEGQAYQKENLFSNLL